MNESEEMRVVLKHLKRYNDEGMTDSNDGFLVGMVGAGIIYGKSVEDLKEIAKGMFPDANYVGVVDPNNHNKITFYNLKPVGI